MLFHDLIEHYRISASPSVIRYVLKRVMNNLTKPTSVNAIYNELKSQGMRVSKDSLYQWLDYACNIFMFYRVPKYTKSLVKENTALPKYYIADIGLRTAVLLPRSEDEGKALENVVYMMLQRTLGEDERIFYFHDSEECDFVVQRGDQVTELLQVCWALDASNTEREVKGLLAASAFTGCTNCKIITHNQQTSIQRGDVMIEVLLVWRI